LGAQMPVESYRRQHLVSAVSEVSGFSIVTIYARVLPSVLMFHFMLFIMTIGFSLT
jgi:hypothetical protein